MNEIIVNEKEFNILKKAVKWTKSSNGTWTCSYGSMSASATPGLISRVAKPEALHLLYIMLKEHGVEIK